MIKLEEFDDNQIREWITVWNQANSATATRPMTVDAAMAQGLLARQPLLLLMLYFADPDTAPPDADLSTPQLYERLFDTYARREVTKQASRPLPEPEQVLPAVDIRSDYERAGVRPGGWRPPRWRSHPGLSEPGARSRQSLPPVPADANVSQQIQQALAAASNVRVSWPDLADQSADAIRVVLLDGLDELLQVTSNDRGGYLTDIVEFQRSAAARRNRAAPPYTRAGRVARSTTGSRGSVMIVTADCPPGTRREGGRPCPLPIPDFPRRH